MTYVLASHGAQDWRANWEEADSLIQSLPVEGQRMVWRALAQASVDLAADYPNEAGNCPVGQFLDELAIVRQIARGFS